MMATATKMAMTVAGTLIASVLHTAVLMAAVPSQIEALANACALCHGTDGRGVKKIPKINSELTVADFIATMKGYADGTEGATIMDRVAKGLTDEEIEQLAEYFANLQGGEENE